MSRELLRSQKNEIFEIIRETNLNVNDFSWSYTTNFSENNSVPQICYAESDFYFTFDEQINWDGSKSLISSFSPCRESICGSYDSNSWILTKEFFQNWLKFLEREISEPDLWNQLKHQQIAIESYENVNDTVQFSYQQTQSIELGINKVKEYVRADLELNNEQLESVNSKLDYLIDSSKRMSIKDWKNILLGVMVNLSLTIPLNPEQGKIMKQLFGSAVNGIMRLIS